jgi:hypothetical protein
LTRTPRRPNGEKRVFPISGARKSRYTHAKEVLFLSYTIQKQIIQNILKT